MKNYYIMGNWKMNPNTLSEALSLAQKILKKIDNKNVKTVIVPPFVWLSNIGKIIKEKNNVFLGAQNVFWQEKGAYTGEISPMMLKNIGVKYIIIGHSEREIYLRETRQMVKNKLNICLKNDITPIVSFRPNNLDNLSEELGNITENIDDKTKIFYLYEPTEAISTQKGKIPSSKKIEMFAEIARETLGDNITILYGGNINASNAKKLIAETGVDGGVIGTKSLDLEEFVNIINNLTK